MRAVRSVNRSSGVVGGLWLSRWVLNYNWAIPGAVLPALGPSLGATGIELAVIVAATAAGQGIAEGPGAAWTSRIEPARLVVVGAALLAVSALASATAASWWTLSLFRAGVGVGSGLFWPASVAVLRESTLAQGFPAAVGAYNASGSLGVVTALSGGLALAGGFGWRTALLVGGVGQLAVAAALGLAHRRPYSPFVRGTHVRRPFDARAVIRSPALWSLTLAGAGLWGLGYLVPQFTLAFVAQVHPAWSLRLAAEFLSGATLIGIPAGIVGGLFAARIGRLPAILAASGAVMAITIAAISIAPFAPFAVLLLVFGAADGVTFAVLYALPARLADIPHEGLSLAIGVLDSTETLLGSLVAFAFGAIAGPFGFRAAWVFAGFVAATPLLLLARVRASAP